ncbi:MAG: hypothetical protein WBF04_13500 [Candidatus Sulfotelmatobacter sp.]
MNSAITTNPTSWAISPRAPTPIGPPISPGTVPARAPFAKPLNPERWQPLSYTDATGNLVLQMFSGAQWCYVTPFALTKGDEFRSAVEPGPFRYGSPGYQEQAKELVAISAGLTDQQKMISEYWADGPTRNSLPAIGRCSRSLSPNETTTLWTMT